MDQAEETLRREDHKCNSIYRRYLVELYSVHHSECRMEMYMKGLGTVAVVVSSNGDVEFEATRLRSRQALRSRQVRLSCVGYRNRVWYVSCGNGGRI